MKGKLSIKEKGVNQGMRELVRKGHFSAGTTSRMICSDLFMESAKQHAEKQNIRNNKILSAYKPELLCVSTKTTLCHVYAIFMEMTSDL